jgi:hypothetical protein
MWIRDKATVSRGYRGKTHLRGFKSESASADFVCLAAGGFNRCGYRGKTHLRGFKSE